MYSLKTSSAGNSWVEIPLKESNNINDEGAKTKMSLNLLESQDLVNSEYEGEEKLFESTNSFDGTISMAFPEQSIYTNEPGLQNFSYAKYTIHASQFESDDVTGKIKTTIVDDNYLDYPK
jgi:hypothetical protein